MILSFIIYWYSPSAGGLTLPFGGNGYGDSGDGDRVVVMERYMMVMLVNQA
jgi:hypothetical protein